MKYTEQLFNGILEPFIENLKTKGFLKGKKKITFSELQHLIKTFAVHFYNKKTEHLDFKNIECNYIKGCKDTCNDIINDLGKLIKLRESELDDYKNNSRATQKGIKAGEYAINEIVNIKLIVQSKLKSQINKQRKCCS